MLKKKKEIKVEKVERTDKPERKKKRQKTIHVGTHKKTVLFLWVLFIAAFIFAIYKNFTAIDKHTVHEKEIVKENVKNTNAIENFTEDFVKIYYTWNVSQESLDVRSEKLSGYITKDLDRINTVTIRSDIPTASSVEDVTVWNVRKVKDSTYEVTYSVIQNVLEGESQAVYEHFYTIHVYQDTDNKMVVVKNPTLAAAYEKSDYEPKAAENDGSVDAESQQEIKEFLETFFKLYPTAEEKELEYYVKNGVLRPIGREELIFSELELNGFKQVEDDVEVHVNVSYLDQQTKMTQVSQYDLTLKKNDNWMIVKNQ